MDSDSSSMQSSSGGDEEAECISTFHGSLSHHPSHPHASSPRLHHPPPSSLFDPVSAYLETFTTSPPRPAGNPDSLNLDMAWAHGFRTIDQPNCTEVGGGLLGSVLPPRDSSAATPVDGLGPGRGPYTGGVTMNSSPLRTPPLASPSDAPPKSNAPGGGAPQRSSRKRTRASRRAPTTVLATDASNFRAIVQEFTGIPAPPFLSSPFPPRSRFDFFNAAAASPVARSPPGHVLGAASHSLLRPFAHKALAPSLGPLAPAGTSSSSSTSSPSTAAPANLVSAAASSIIGTNSEGSLTRTSTSSVAANAPSAITTSFASNTYQRPSVGDQHQGLLSMLKNFQSSPSTRYSSLGAAVLSTSRAMQDSRLLTAPAAGHAVGGRLGLPASEGTPSPGGGSSHGRDVLLQWVEGSGGSEGDG